MTDPFRENGSIPLPLNRTRSGSQIVLRFSGITPCDERTPNEVREFGVGACVASARHVTGPNVPLDRTVILFLDIVFEVSIEIFVC